MCATCGCGNHDHDHRHDHDHGHVHEAHEMPHVHPRHSVRTVRLEQEVLGKNTRLAARNRVWLGR